MKKVNYPRLADGYFEEVLPCGLHLRVIPRPGFGKFYCFYAINYGAVDTTFTVDGRTVTTPDGVAHYLEHKMFDMPYGDAMNRFAALGGSPNAFTSHTMTAYYVECTEHLQENLQTLVELVNTPYFTQASVEKERGIIAQEIGMYRDSADARVNDNLLAAMYHVHPARAPIAGTEESISRITPQLLKQCHEAFYAPSNAMLCIMGDVDAGKILDWVLPLLPQQPVSRARAEYGAEPAWCRSSRITDTMEISMPNFILGFKDVPCTGMEAVRQEFAGDLAADLLLSASAPLYTRLYEEGLVETSFSSGCESMKNLSFFSAGGESRDPDAVLEAILQEADRVNREGLDADAFRRMKKAALGRKLRELDSFEGTCFRMCACYFEGTEYFDTYAVLQNMEKQDVEAYIRRVLRRENACVSVIEMQA